MSSTGLPILTYHAIDTSGSVISTSPSWFVETMRLLHDSGWRTVGLADWVARGRPPLERMFALTFDDGLRSILTAADTLVRYTFQATAFIVTDRMGGDNAWPGQPPSIPRAPLLRWTDLSALAAAGFEFGSHTRSHVNVNLCGESTLAPELRGSREALEDRLSQRCRLLAYPYGAAGDRVRRAAVREYEAAFGARLDLASQGESSAFISRIDAYYLRSARALDRLISARLQPWLDTRRALRRVRAASTLLAGR
jgi:peptidoglycan/xylan/chitin deacetylase (PgdA/CDA1 family)